MTGPKNEESELERPEDAKERFQKWKDKDPYPDILPALLNSADIHDYIETTGMVDPYDLDLMKSSSYEARIGDFAYLWDENDERKDIPLDENSTVELPPNSLVFFETKEEFRLPSYMAIRFNLRITNVHRGLLLGTGPLVDPGFEGKLLIPIHNLTNNPYRFYGDDPFIWIEFTKISHNKIWNQKLREETGQNGIYKRFPKDKIGLSASDYFKKANNGNRIQNAVPAALEDARQQAYSAKASADRAETKIDARTIVGAAFGLAGLTIAAVAAVIAFHPLITNSVNLSKDVANVISDLSGEYQGHLEQEQSFDSRIIALETNISNLRDTVQIVGATAGQKIQIDQIQKEIDALKNELNSLKTVTSGAEPSPKKAN